MGAAVVGVVDSSIIAIEIVDNLDGSGNGPQLDHLHELVLSVQLGVPEVLLGLQKLIIVDSCKILILDSQSQRVAVTRYVYRQRYNGIACPQPHMGKHPPSRHIRYSLCRSGGSKIGARHRYIRWHPSFRFHLGNSVRYRSRPGTVRSSRRRSSCHAGRGIDWCCKRRSEK